MTEVTEIPLDSITPFPGNRRIGGFDEHKLEQLADSIRELGVQQPAVVRPSTNGGGEKALGRTTFELIAGERRWRASKIAGKETLPCIVRDLSDVEAIRIQLVENLQRDDVHPLDEAECFRHLLDIGEYDVATLADEVGRSRSYVYQRMKLRDLVDDARELLIEGKITSGHAILLARLPADSQRQALEFLFYYEDNIQPVKDFSRLINQRILLELDGAAFPKDDATLVPTAGPCTTCPKRTGYEPALFPEITGSDRCTDAGCFNAKLDELVRRRREQLKGTGYREVNRGYYGGADNKAVREWEWEECNQTDEGAFQALIVAGPERGKVTWGKKRSYGYDVSTMDPEERERIEKQNRERELRFRAEKIALEKISEEVRVKTGGHPTPRAFWEYMIWSDTTHAGVDDEVIKRWLPRFDLESRYEWPNLKEALDALPDADVRFMAMDLLIPERTWRLPEFAESVGVEVEKINAEARKKAELEAEADKDNGT
jgi:ParB family chromosome partitioning protein